MASTLLDGAFCHWLSNVSHIATPGYLLVIKPILRASRYYNDDLKNTCKDTGLDSNGRPFGTLLDESPEVLRPSARGLSAQKGTVRSMISLR